jgi:hypothetical protein
MRWPAGAAAAAGATTKNGDDDTNDARAQHALGTAAGFAAIASLMRLAQRRAWTVMRA